MARDRRVDCELADLGWTAVRVWEHEIRDDLTGVVTRIRHMLGYTDAQAASHTDPATLPG